MPSLREIRAIRDEAIGLINARDDQGLSNLYARQWKILAPMGFGPVVAKARQRIAARQNAQMRVTVEPPTAPSQNGRPHVTGNGRGLGQFRSDEAAQRRAAKNERWRQNRAKRAMENRLRKTGSTKPKKKDGKK